MALASCSGFFFLFCLVFLIKSADSRCEKRFDCGQLDPLEFPFSNDSECGLFMVNCSESPPSFQLGPEGPRFFIHETTSANKFVVVDPDLWSDERCHSIQNRSLPHFPYISFAITSPNITILSCSSKFLDPKDEERMRAYFVHRYKTNSECEHSYFYYGFPSHAISAPEYCSIVRMPVLWPDLEIPYFKLLSTFELEWRVSANCTKCHDKGGKCLADSNNKFLCEGSRKNSKTIILVAAITVSAAVFLGLCFVLSFLIYRRKKGANGAYLLSRNISCDPSSKSDIEGSRLFFGIPIFSYTELEEATNNFNPSKELGDGGFGTVYYGKLRDGREVAIKRLYEHNCKGVEQFMNEIRILTCLRHPNLVSLYGCTSRRSRELLLVYEYIPNGTVADHLHGERANTAPLSWPVRMNIAIEIASALAYLHNSDIIHRDIKTYNILLDNNFCVKVADFGLSRLFPNDVSHISTAPQGTPGYVDPDYRQCYQLTDKSDVYSFGVVLIELISSMPAVDITRHRHEINLANLALNRIQRCAFDELIDMSLGYKSDAEVARMTTSVAELAFRCLQLERDMRPSMDEVLDSLMDIKAGEHCEFEQTKESNGIHIVPAKISPSPETGDVLLNKTNIQSSPVSVTDR